MSHKVENLRQDDRTAKYLALVDQIGEPPGVRLGLELHSRTIALLVEEREGARAQFTEQPLAHDVLEEDVSPFVELSARVCGHGHGPS